MTEIYDSAEGSENTLDHWAGYALNPEDRVKLEPTIKSLVGRAPLLRKSAVSTAPTPRRRSSTSAAMSPSGPTTTARVER